MSIKTSHFILAILSAVIIGIFIGRAFPYNTNNTPPINLTAEKTSPKLEDKEMDTTQQVTQPDPIAVTETEEDNNPTLSGVKMGISDAKISQVLTSIAKNLEAKNLDYDASKSQDCSGIYHQLKDSIQARIPALRQGSEYQYPQYETDRSSRQIADWYHRNNNLLIVDDPIASKNSIRPGTVLFFGRSRKGIKKLSINDLTDRDNSFTRNGIIMHVAVVTEVFRDDDNNLVGYDMMHGRNSTTPASRSGSKEKQSTTETLPPFGNWSQHWVAAANIATPK